MRTSASRPAAEAAGRRSSLRSASKASSSTRAGTGANSSVPELNEQVKVWSKSAGAWLDGVVVGFVKETSLKVLVEYTLPDIGYARKTLAPTSANLRRLVAPSARPRAKAGTSAAGTGWVATAGLRTEDQEEELEPRSREASASPQRREATPPWQLPKPGEEPPTPQRSSLRMARESGARLREKRGGEVVRREAPGGDTPAEKAPAGESHPRELREGDRVGDGRFELRHQIGAGSFSTVRLAKDLHTGDEVALKIEPEGSFAPQLLQEARRYRQFSNGGAVPRLYWFGSDAGYNIMALELLGPSLDVAFERCSRKFSLTTTVRIAQQMIHLVGFLHERDYLHRDLKPNNFCVGLHGDDRSRVYVVDFGLAKRYRTSRFAGSEHVAFRSGHGFVGTVRYASLAAHLGAEQSRADDMEALGYIFVYFLRGSLPWQNVVGETKTERREAVKMMKLTISIEGLCDKCPVEFADYLESVKALAFQEEPDYAQLSALLGQAAERQASKGPSRGADSPRRRGGGGGEVLPELCDAVSAASEGQW